MKSLSRGAAYLLSLGAACAVIPQVAAMSSAPAPELKEHYTGPASGLAQGCFVLQSPASGLFVQYEPNSGITDGKPAYSSRQSQRRSPVAFISSPVVRITFCSETPTDAT